MYAKLVTTKQKRPPGRTCTSNDRERAWIIAPQTREQRARYYLGVGYRTKVRLVMMFTHPSVQPSLHPSVSVALHPFRNARDYSQRLSNQIRPQTNRVKTPWIPKGLLRLGVERDLNLVFSCPPVIVTYSSCATFLVTSRWVVIKLSFFIQAESSGFLSLLSTMPSST